MFQRKLCMLGLALSLLFSLFLSASSGQARVDQQPDIAAIDAFLTQSVKANRIPGLAVGIVQGDRVIFLKGYGEAAPGQPVTPQTQFYIGSLSKSFTALAAMQLVEQGKLDLDAPVQQYLPWFQVADETASGAITLRNLLNHTSGLSERGDPNAAVYTANLEEQGRLLKDARLTAPVGTQFQYYNQNYRLVGLLIEQVSGQSFADYLQAQVFQPLGMSHSVADPAQAPQLIQGHSRAFGFAVPQATEFIPGGLPSGYLISTAEDMSAFLSAQITNRQADGRPMLAPQSLAEMRSLPAGIKTEYGMGWMVLENGSMLAHGGSVDGFQAFETIRLNQQLGLIILYNQNGLENMLLENDAIRGGLLKLLAGETPQVVSYGWLGWLLLALAGTDLFNHVRLLRGLPGWAQRTGGQNKLWRWAKISLGIALPLFVIFGLPLMVKALQGGEPTWSEPLHLMPDLTVWLLLGMGLDLVRSLVHAAAVVKEAVSGQRSAKK